MNTSYFDGSYGTISSISSETGVPARTLRDAKNYNRINWKNIDGGVHSYEVCRDGALRAFLKSRGAATPTHTGTPSFSSASSTAPTSDREPSLLDLLTEEEIEAIRNRRSSVLDRTDDTDDDTSLADLQWNGEYTYDRGTDEYHFFLEAFPDAPWVMPKAQAKRICSAYSDDDGVRTTIPQISYSEGVPESVVKEVLRALGKTHASDRFLPEEMTDRTVDDMVEETIESKQVAYKRKLEQRIWKKQEEDANKWRAFEESVQELIASTVRPIDPINIKRLTPSKDLPERGLVLNLQDVHWGKLAAYGNSDAEEYEAALMRAIKYLLKQAHRSAAVERVFLVVGGDFFHVDTEIGTTSRGTAQQLAMTPQRMISTGHDFLEQIVFLCRQLAEVDLVYVKGNHDSLLSWYAYKALASRFADFDDVFSIVDSSRPRQYRVYEQHLLAFTHGDMNASQRKAMNQLILEDARELYGTTKFTSTFTGHLHTGVTSLDDNGTWTFQAPSPAVTDQWHDNQGYSANKAGVLAVLVSGHHAEHETIFVSLAAAGAHTYN